MAAFEELGVMTELIESLKEMEWSLPTPIQTEAIPLILGGGDVMAAAETGSGKTGAFALPILQITSETLTGGNNKSSAKSSSDQLISFNKDDKDPSFQIVDSNSLCGGSNTGRWTGARASRGLKGTGHGVYYFEAQVTKTFQNGVARVGWSLSQASLDLGTDEFGYGYGSFGKKSNSRQFDNYGEQYGLNDVISCWIDMDNRRIGFCRNGINLGAAFENIPINGSSTFFPTVALKNSEITINFGQLPFKYPCAHIPLSQARDLEAASVIKTTKGRHPICVIIEPSRELATQTHNALVSFSKYLVNPEIKSTVIVGGIPPNEQLRSLRAGVDIITATPGRFEDFVKNGNICLENVKFFVLDEADNLAENNLALILQIYGMLPKAQLQVLMFSATLHSVEIKNLSEKITRFPTWVDLKGKDSIPDTVDHFFVYADPTTDTRFMNALRINTDEIHKRDQKGSRSPEMLSENVKLLKGYLFYRIIEGIKPNQALVFCRTKVDCDNLEDFLNRLGGKQSMIEHEYSCVCVHGDRSVPERGENLQRFKDGEVRFLICTDVASRGIDVKELPCVINMTLPDKPEDYVHRVGRVGRAEMMGLAISIVSKIPEKVWYHSCPNRGKNCNNTKLAEKGGCAIWYNEMDYWTAINERMKIPIDHLTPEFKLPGQEGEGDDQQKIEYGRQRIGGGFTFESHATELKSHVESLANLEDISQLSYWDLLSKFK